MVFKDFFGVFWKFHLFRIFNGTNKRHETVILKKEKLCLLGHRMFRGCCVVSGYGSLPCVLVFLVQLDLAHARERGGSSSSYQKKKNNKT